MPPVDRFAARNSRLSGTAPGPADPQTDPSHDITGAA